MKVKQLLKHFWHGASTINSIVLYGNCKPIATIGDECFRTNSFGDYENATVNLFLVEKNVLRIYLKPDR